MSSAWNTFVLGCRDRYGVASVDDARAAAVPGSTFYRRTSREGWTEPYPGVRVAPWVQPSPRTDLAALLHALGPHAAASGDTAAWLHGLRSAPPRKLEVIVPHHDRVPQRALGHVRRSRWLQDDDLIRVQRLAALKPASMLVSSAATDPVELRALVIDARHRGLVELPDVATRLASVGPVRGRRTLARILHELSDREPESIFHDLVLEELMRLGYGPSPAPIRVETPDGRGVHPDIPLPLWCVAIEVQGDRFHRTRPQRAADRRKTSQYAGTGWAVLELDWWEWMGDREHFLTALDAAITSQVRRGVADPATLPLHLRAAAKRVRANPAGAAATASGNTRTR